ncbi:helix-turn-helix transcriptional regulator [Paraburkholderia phenazinium]|uniref:Transcriptional regulator, AlpA family n=1 Tax=Paraburkholderia phenazinium TaxID=60549 RepID=A0A1G8FJZ5_9BURK|nr:AlpA family phage regulatory protein [Paraburkholderia phenazinium]SDH82444.1 transcriptional regulator, AlpA family [Paraburkholderia phenazinium]
MANTLEGTWLRPAQAAVKLGIGTSTLWHKAKVEPDFPRPVKVSARVTIFLERDLDAYLERMATAKRPESHAA